MYTHPRFLTCHFNNLAEVRKIRLSAGRFLLLSALSDNLLGTTNETCDPSDSTHGQATPGETKRCHLRRGLDARLAPPAPTMTRTIFAFETTQIMFGDGITVVLSSHYP